VDYKCGSLQAHHFITRSNKRLRWDLRNRVFLCVTHHVFGYPKSAHKDPTWFWEWFKTNRPKDFEYCERLKNEKSYSINYIEILEYLNAENKTK
jgi:hypothetical protein